MCCGLSHCRRGINIRAHTFVALETTPKRIARDVLRTTVEGRREGVVQIHYADGLLLSAPNLERERSSVGTNRNRDT